MEIFGVTNVTMESVDPFAIRITQDSPITTRTKVAKGATINIKNESCIKILSPTSQPWWLGRICSTIETRQNDISHNIDLMNNLNHIIMRFLKVESTPASLRLP